MDRRLTLHSLSRRDFLRATAGIAGVTMVAACAAPGAAPAAGGGAVAPAGEAIEVTFMGWGATEEDEGVKSAQYLRQNELGQSRTLESRKEGLI